MLSTDAQMLTQGEDWILLPQHIPLRFAIAARVLPFEKVPCGDDEVERCEYIRGGSLNTSIVVIQLRAEIISCDKVE